MNSTKIDNLLQYGISTQLAQKVESVGLTVSKARALSQRDIHNIFNLTKDEAKILSNAVNRKPIDSEVVQTLLERSNFVCNICKGVKSHAYIIHHIEEYSVSQDNSYQNLIVLCPSDHDLAHQTGLTLKIKKEQLLKSKANWEKTVEIANAQRAAFAIEVNDGAIDYVNVKRIEELCVGLFKDIPSTTVSEKLKQSKVLDPTGSFDQKHVQSVISGGRYLFDYMSINETEHYKQLLQKISSVTDFIDLDTEASLGFEAVQKLQGAYAYFIGGVCAKGPKFPITEKSLPITMSYTRKGLRIEWILDPMFLMSMSAITRIGGKNRYIVYCLVRTVQKSDDGSTIEISASPLLIAQPTKYVNKMPGIAYQKQYKSYVEQGLID